MRFALSLLCLLALVAVDLPPQAVIAQHKDPVPVPQPTGPSLTVPSAVKVDQPGLVVVRATALDADDVRWWSIGPGLQTFPPDIIAPKLGVYMGFALQQGTYKVGVIAAKTLNGKAVIGQAQTITITVGNPPAPEPPVPPTPPTPPTPPSPSETPAMVIIEDAKQRMSLTTAQEAVLFDADMRQVFNTALPLGPNGMTHEWRIWDKSFDVSSDPSIACKKLFALAPPTKLPWYRISNGKAFFEGPVTDKAAMRAVFDKIK